MITRIKKAKKIDEIIVCTTSKNEDLKIVNIAKKNKVGFFRGENNDVLKRMLGLDKKIQN